ncbi:MAG: GspH/FimT family pseudopilin [Stenotrophobium sp.]
MHKSSAGFSLIELIVTTTLVGILAALATPSFINTLRNNRLAAYTNEFTTALTLARTESVKRNVIVGVCRSASATSKKPSCDSGSGNGGWENGWLVFADLNGSKSFDDGDAILYRRGALTGGVTVIANGNITNRLIFTSRGILSPDSFGSIKLDDNYGGLRVICMTITGRARLAPGGVTEC